MMMDVEVVGFWASGTTPIFLCDSAPTNACMFVYLCQVLTICKMIIAIKFYPK